MVDAPHQVMVDAPHQASKWFWKDRWHLVKEVRKVRDQLFAREFSAREDIYVSW